MDKMVTALQGKGELMIEATGTFQIKKDFPTPDGGSVPYLSPAWKKAFEAWRAHYNGERPHSALGNLAPEYFVRASAPMAAAVFAEQDLAVVS